MALARRTGSSDRGCRNGNGLDGVDELPERGAERIVERSVDLEASVMWVRTPSLAVMTTLSAVGGRLVAAPVMASTP
jgi:hypothetical protein